MRSTVSAAALSILVLAAVSTVSMAAVSIYMHPEDLARRAPLIVEGTVLDVASGMDPDRGTIATYITIGVGTVHRGPDDLDRVVIREPGGAFGDLVHELDAVPTYTVGEEVFVFLEPSPDGVLRTAGMFYGKFVLSTNENGRSSNAGRDLRGRGRIIGRPGNGSDIYRTRDLASLAAAMSPHRPETRNRVQSSRRGLSRLPVGCRATPAAEWVATPSELGRIQWNRTSRKKRSAAGLTSATTVRSPLVGMTPGSDSIFKTHFTTLSSSNPTRWYEVDSGQTLLVDVQRANDPLGDEEAAVAEIKRAFTAWTAVPESRLELASGNDNANFTGVNSSSPAVAYPPGNIILFGDPYGDISDPSSCSGVLAIGGYWRSGSTGAQVNGVTFNRALRMYVIFNNKFECFLGITDNLAEVATHELGHCIGLGHSTINDAIMRSSAYGGRGPRLGEDDMDAVHCVYPHTLTVTYPNGGQSLTSGGTEDVLWSATPESSGDYGTVDVDYSTNGGVDWSAIAVDTPNDGSVSWTVPSTASEMCLVRVIRNNRVPADSAPFPTACSQDSSDDSFSIVGAPPLAGSVPDGTAGFALTVAKAGDTEITVSWGASCSPDAEQYALYQGSLEKLAEGSWDHTPVTCTAGVDLNETFTPVSDSSYYLVSPLAGTAEGSLGTDGAGLERPESSSPCGVREAESACP